MLFVLWRESGPSTLPRGFTDEVGSLDLRPVQSDVNMAVVLSLQRDSVTVLSSPGFYIST